MRKLYAFALVAAAMILAACGGNAPAGTNLQGNPVEIQATNSAILVEIIAAQQATLQDLVAAQETEEPAVAPAVEPTAASSADDDASALMDASSSENDNPTISMDWGSANVPASVTTIKANLTDGCTMPDVVCYMLDDAGVLGADNLAEADANPSAIWTGSAWHQMAQGPLVGILVPEGSYATWYSASSTVDGGGYHLEFNSMGEDQCWGVLVRGWFEKTHADRHVPIAVTNYGALGAMVYTRYPVEPQNGQFFSQAVNALNFDNSGIGDEDCVKFWQAVFDYNDGSLTVLNFTEEAGWSEVWTNISGHGR